MSELKLREFGARAEELVTLPDVAELEHRGRELRHRRVALVAALAACVLAVAGLLVLRDEPQGAVEPVRPPDGEGIGGTPYPGAVMQTLRPGTYWIDMSAPG